MTTPAELQAAIERLCPSAKVDSELRDQLLAFRLKPREAKEMQPHLAVEIIRGDLLSLQDQASHHEHQIVLIPVLDKAFWDSKDAQRNFIRKLGEYFAEQKLQPIVIYLVSEAWAKIWPREEMPKEPVDLRLQEVKREIVMARALTIDGRTGAAFAEILRDDAARISGYGEIEQVACSSLQENGEASTEVHILKPFFRGYLQRYQQARFEHAQGTMPNS